MVFAPRRRWPKAGQHPKQVHPKRSQSAVSRTSTTKKKSFPSTIAVSPWRQLRSPLGRSERWTCCRIRFDALDKPQAVPGYTTQYRLDILLDLVQGMPPLGPKRSSSETIRHDG